MSLSSSTLSAVQKAGTAALAADARLKKELQDHAQRVTAAMAQNAFGADNDALIESWKVIAGLSQTLAGIEAELQKVYQLISQLTTQDLPSVVEIAVAATPTSQKKRAPKQHKTKPLSVKAARKTVAQPAAPEVAAPKRALKSEPIPAPTEVAVKTKKAPARKTRSGTSQVEQTPAGAPTLGGNSTKLLSHLAGVLSTDEFTAFSQTAAAKATAIPLGSMTAAIKKLLESGRITAGPNASFKLVTAAPDSQSPIEA